MSIPSIPIHTSNSHARFMHGLSKHWLSWFTMLTGIWVGLPWIAPLLMHQGMTQAAWLIYAIYSPQCHQLPQRSYFLFGDQFMVPLTQILALTEARDPLTLRWFLGTPVLGWKVAWSDRMVSLYTPLFVGALVYQLVGKRWKPVSWSWKLLVPYLPLLIDGMSHMLDDGLALGFRATNTWLIIMTGGAFAPQFYAGDALGSFNWWMRLITGLVAGFAFAFHVYPHLEQGFKQLADPTPRDGGQRFASTAVSKKEIRS